MKLHPSPLPNVSATLPPNSPRAAATNSPRLAVALASWLLATSAGLVTVDAAGAADLSGDCCADLEERIAELEALSVRKGNRRVSLTVSGQVSQAVLAWDDGAETNVYQVSNSNSSDRLRFQGSAAVSRDVTAGYRLELAFGLPSSAGVDQFTDEGGNFGLRVRHSLWFLRSKTFGSVSVGQASPSTDDIIAYNLGQTSVAGPADVGLLATNLFTRDSTVSGSEGLNALSSGNTMSLRWRRFVPQLDTRRGNLVRYDTPVFHGFAASASWGENDFWDVAVRFARDFGDLRVAGGMGYYENREEEASTFGWPRGGDGDPESSTGGTAVREWKGSLSALHEPTGLFVSGAYVHRQFSGSDLGTLSFACFSSADAASIRGLGIACDNRPDFDYYWVSAGVRRNFIPAGKTSVYGEYAQSRDAVTGLNVAVSSAVGGDIDYITDSTMHMWGIGIVQDVVAALMDLFISYRHFSADVVGLESTGAIKNAPLEDADVIFAGSRIRF